MHVMHNVVMYLPPSVHPHTLTQNNTYRLHKDVHQAELKLEVAQHNKALVQQEAAEAAAGQTQQVLRRSHEHCVRVCLCLRRGEVECVLLRQTHMLAV